MDVYVYLQVRRYTQLPAVQQEIFLGGYFIFSTYLYFYIELVIKEII